METERERERMRKREREKEREKRTKKEREGDKKEYPFSRIILASTAKCDGSKPKCDESKHSLMRASTVSTSAC